MHTILPHLHMFLVKGHRQPPSKYHSILSFIHFASHVGEACKKRGWQGLPKPWEKSRTVRGGQLTSVQSLCRKGTFKSLALPDTSFFSPTNCPALYFPHYCICSLPTAQGFQNSHGWDLLCPCAIQSHGYISVYLESSFMLSY